MNFYNTIHATDQTLIDFEYNNLNQSEKVLAFFKSHSNAVFTPFDIKTAFDKMGYNYPITSIRRAITDLTIQGSLIMHPKEQMKQGAYGKPNHTWQFNTLKTHTHV